MDLKLSATSLVLCPEYDEVTAPLDSYCDCRRGCWSQMCSCQEAKACCVIAGKYSTIYSNCFTNLCIKETDGSIKRYRCNHTTKNNESIFCNFCNSLKLSSTKHLYKI